MPIATPSPSNDPIYPTHIVTRDALLPKIGPKPWFSAPTGDIVLANAQIIDVQSGTLVDGDIVISKGLIEAIIPSGQSTQYDYFAHVDLHGKYICP
jgi:hypothetical protein